MSYFDVRRIQEEYLNKWHYDDFYEIIDRLKKCALNRNIAIEGELTLWTENDLRILDAYLCRCGFTVYIDYHNCESNSFRITIA